MPEESSIRVLVVDDDRSIRNLLRVLLSKEGYDVVVAADGQEGFRMATREEFDLIIMDLAMENWDGQTAINSLSMVRPETKIVCFSGYLNDDLKEQLQSLPNVFGCIDKPVGLDQLTGLISSILSSSDSAGES
ncbi:MAG: response regulator [Planctomycetes bacterium]|nr:response regulator [Planctomycetota bacterium]